MRIAESVAKGAEKGGYKPWMVGSICSMSRCQHSEAGNITLRLAGI